MAKRYLVKKGAYSYVDLSVTKVVSNNLMPGSKVYYKSSIGVSFMSISPEDKLFKDRGEAVRQVLFNISLDMMIYKSSKKALVMKLESFMLSEYSKDIKAARINPIRVSLLRIVDKLRVEAVKCKSDLKTKEFIMEIQKDVEDIINNQIK